MSTLPVTSDFLGTSISSRTKNDCLRFYMHFLLCSIWNCKCFNAHPESWGDFRSDARREALFDVIVTAELVALNDRREMFGPPRAWHHVRVPSVSLSCFVVAEPESRGSGRLPILLIPSRPKPNTLPERPESNWDMFFQRRELSIQCDMIKDIACVIFEALALATPFNRPLLKLPAPNLK